MSCFKKNNVKKRYKCKIVPVKNNDINFMESFLRESMHCGNCRKIYSLNSNELKIHCNICNQFFHCGIAGECIGDDCRIYDSDGKIKHRARYCNNCVSKIYNKETCLCKYCDKK